MEQKRLVPNRRFVGFEGEWEIEQLDNLADIIGGGTPSTSNPNYWNGSIDWYSPTEIGHKTYATSSVKTITQAGLAKSSARILPPNKTILFTSRAGIGDMAILKHPGATNQGFQSLVLKEGIDTYFLYSMGNLIKKYAVKNASGSTFLEVSGKTLGNMSLLIPKIEEQQKIGQFFKQLDEMIATEQRKVEKIKALKSAYLAEMFPAEGESVPKRRFAGFSGDWQNERLDSVADIVGGGTPSTNNPNYWNGNIDWYSPTEIGSKVYATGSVKKITNAGLAKSSSRVLPPNKTILFTSRAGIGDMAILKRPGATNQGFQSLVLKDGINTYFLYSMGNLIKKYAMKNATGSTFLEISGKKLGDMTLLIPTTKEQQKIGQFFKQLDNKITNAERKLAKLESMKQAYLQEMFV